MTASLAEFQVLLAAELAVQQADGAGRLELARIAEQRVRSTYGLACEDVSAFLDEHNTMHVRYRYPVRPEFIRINVTIKEPEMFKINDEDWADAKPGTMRAVPHSAGTVRYEVWDGHHWRQSGGTATLFSHDSHDVTSTPTDSGDGTHYPTR